MKTEKITDLIARLEHKTEEHLTVTVKTFQNLTDTALLRPSTTGGWSIAQCLDHLNRYGHYYLPEIKSAMDRSKRQRDAYASEGSDFFKSGWFGNYFTNMMDPKTGKSYKAFKEYIPSLELNAHEVVAEFILQQETLLMYLNNAATTDLSTRLPISITSLIKLKLGDVFQFLIMHNERHLLQAKRNLGQVL